ncbi:MbnP family protein [Flavicella marina]|uniref:MbnP family protein n=1 Tax=Flavicella marina TaxID=1475951 RepID=UPI0012657D42|nr:MbnP family protein [Flavicella marina]
MKNIKIVMITVIAVITFTACNNSDTNMEHDNGTHVSAVIKLDHSIAIGDEFTIQQQADGVTQTLVLDKFKFLISDVSVKTANNNMISIPNNVAGSLIDLAKADDKEVKLYLTEIPDGEYKSITFGIGVSDEVASGSADAQSRLFDLASADMNWSWNPNSYIFSKIEATNKLNMMNHMAKSETEDADNLWIHIGKKGDFDGFRTVTLDFPQNITVKNEVSPSVHVKVNIEKLFTPDNGVTVYLGAPNSSDFADNYANIFEVHHVHPLDEAVDLEDVEQDDHDHSDSEGSSHSH